MSNDKFRVKYGLAVGDNTTPNAMTVDGTTGDVSNVGLTSVYYGKTGQVTIGGSSSGKLEIGQQGRATSGTPYLDFHSGTGGADYDVRLLVTGGATAPSTTSGTGNLDVYAGTVTYNGDLAVTGSETITGNLAVNGGAITTTSSTASLFDGVSTTGTLNMGAYTGTINVGGTTGNNTVNIGTGITTSPNTKTINIGTAGASGSTTNINIGSSTSGALGTTTINSGATMTLGTNATTTTNIGSTTVGSSIVNGALRSPFVAQQIYGTPTTSVYYRGLMINNAASGAYATARTGLVLRSVPTAAAGPRGGIVFENARTNSSGVPANLQGPTTSQVGDYLGEILAGGYATDRYTTDAVASAPMAFTPYATEDWSNTAGTNNNVRAGCGWALQLQPTATNLSTTSKVTTVDTTPQNLSLRSDLVGFSKGKTSQFTATGCSTSGTTLTIGTLAAGSISVGSMVQNSTNLLPAGTYIVANISGSGSGSTWTLNQSPGTLSSLTILGNQGYMSMTGTGNVDIMGNLTVRGTPGASTVPINYTKVYGQFQWDATVTPAAANTAYVFPIQGASGVVDFSSIASVASTSRIIPGAPGMYKLQFSIQINNADNGTEHTAYIWWKKNGTDVTSSMGRVTVPKAGAVIAGWDNMISSANNTDYWELAYAVDDTNLTFPYFGATAFGPATAALFITVVPVGA